MPKITQTKTILLVCFMQNFPCLVKPCCCPLLQTASTHQQTSAVNQLRSDSPSEQQTNLTLTNLNPKPSSLSAHLIFFFDQIDTIEKEHSQKHETLKRIQAWLDSKNSQNEITEPVWEPITAALSNEEAEMNSEPVELVKKEVELVHLWLEWTQLMDRLVYQNYFDHRRKDKDKMVL
ncbi:unnamed protein product [Vicia faba]|uniref:Uncharacterized protein n=1 Tax=Vicia faba TaxID=3906 RepID=A0AAV1A173_VICFA|nr:unnamed protein product [Vicia faba]